MQEIPTSRQKRENGAPAPKKSRFLHCAVARDSGSGRNDNPNLSGKGLAKIKEAHPNINRLGRVLVGG